MRSWYDIISSSYQRWGKAPQLHILERTNWRVVLLDELNQEWPGGPLVVPTMASWSGLSFCIWGSRNCGLELLGKLLLVRQQGQGWWFWGEARVTPVNHHSCKDMGTEKGQNEWRWTLSPCSGCVRSVFRGNIRQIRCPSKQRVCAIVGTQALTWVPKHAAIS